MDVSFNSLPPKSRAKGVTDDGSLMNSLQAIEQWNSFMDSPSGAWLGFINGDSPF